MLLTPVWEEPGSNEVNQQAVVVGRLVHQKPLQFDPSLNGSKVIDGLKDGKLLAIYGNQDFWADYVSDEFFHLFRLLIHAYGWVAIPHQGNPGSWTKFSEGVVSTIGGRAPDTLLFMEDYNALNLTGNRSETALASTKLMLFMDDLHSHTEKARIAKVHTIREADCIVGCYMYLLDSYYHNISSVKPRTWLPHAASSEFQLPLKPAQQVANKVFLSGAISSITYPYRALVVDKINAGDARFVHHKHPGYGGKHAGGKQTGAGYARLLNSHLACLTDSARSNYAVAKLFEIPAAGCLLLANSEITPVLSQLGFKPRVHYIVYTKDTLDAVVDYVLNPASAAAVDIIRRQGQGLAWARHTVAIRANQLHASAIT